MREGGGVVSARVRILYEKRGGACFVPHVALATIFARAALRARLVLSMTQGFSPRPKMSFGPELPAGVVALAEPLDAWLEDAPGDMLGRWGAAMPEGFRLLSAQLLEEHAPRLGTACQAALYHVRGVGALRGEALIASARACWGDAVLRAEADAKDGTSCPCVGTRASCPSAGLDIEGRGRAEWASIVLAAPAQNGIGGWVKRAVTAGEIDGWHDLNIVRAAIGGWDGREGRVVPLV